MTASSAALFAAVFALVVATRFGYRRAQMVRAGADYRGAKAAVKPARTAFRRSIVRAFTSGAVVVAVLAVLLVWAARDARDNDPPLRPSPTSSPAAPKRRRTRHRGLPPAGLPDDPHRSGLSRHTPSAQRFHPSAAPRRAGRCPDTAGTPARHRPSDASPPSTAPGCRLARWSSLREPA